MQSSIDFTDLNGQKVIFPIEILDDSTPLKKMLASEMLINMFQDLSETSEEDRLILHPFATTEALNWISQALFFMKEKRQEFEEYDTIPFEYKEDEFGRLIKRPEVGLKHLPIYVDCELIYPEKRQKFIYKSIIPSSEDLQKLENPYNFEKDFEAYGPLSDALQILRTNPILYAQIYTSCDRLCIEYLTDFLFYAFLNYRYSVTVEESASLLEKYYARFGEDQLVLLNAFRTALNNRRNCKSLVYRNHPRLVPRLKRDYESESDREDHMTDEELGLITGKEFVEANYYFFQKNN